MSHSSQDIPRGQRFLLLVADPLINGIFIFGPLLLVLYPLFYMGYMTHYAFLKSIFFLFAATYLNKDLPEGRSLAKRFLGYAVVKQSNGKPPRKAACFLRNITLLIYPAELVWGLFSPSHKLLDHFTQTKIIAVPKDTHPIRSFYTAMKNITYNDETREALGLTVLLFLIVLFLK